MNDEITSKFGNKIRIRVCGVLLKGNSILLVRHSGLGPKKELWIPPGGGINFGESFHSALKREFSEETGLDVTVGRFLCINEFIQPPLHAIEFFFEVFSKTGMVPQTGTDPELTDNQIIDNVEFVTFEKLGVMKKEIKHRILRNVTSGNDLLNLESNFKI